MKILITGGCGFLGSNLAYDFLEKEYDVYIIDSLFRLGSSDNLKWLKSHKSSEKLKFFKFDLSEKNLVDSFFENNSPFDYICHVAGRVAMTTSIENPHRDILTNVFGTFNILEATRKFSPKAFIAYSSTNKVYGDLENLNYGETSSRYVLKDFKNGLDETTRLDFSTPYGCSKGSADQYVRDWARVFDLQTIVFRHSSIYGGRQYASFDQGWIGWFCKQALIQEKLFSNKEKIYPFTISGSGKQVRDVLHASDIVKLYSRVFDVKDKVSGQVFNIGGGYKNSLSLLELFNLIEKYLDIDKLTFEKKEKRASDQKVFIADISKARNLIGWEPEINSNDGIKSMLNWTKIILNENKK